MALVACAILAAAAGGGSHSAATQPRPAQAPLADRDFWRLVTDFSEPGGTFHSENYLSNENLYQTVVPELVSRVRPGGLYLGVGPEQNFTYIAALRPRMAFIVDIRRGNLQEHLLYKALMELSATRVEFVSKLFGRRLPASLGASATAEQIFDAAGAAAADEAMFNATLAAVFDRLVKVRGFALDAADRTQIEFIYRHAFFDEGPSVMYRRTDGRSAGRRPTYAELMTSDDGAGRNRSYLASEAAYGFLRNLQMGNLLVPLVGDFGGPKALRSVGRYARDHDMTVTAYYLSNVEQYLRQDGKYQAFCASVAAMPLDASSTFIRSTPSYNGFFSSLGAMRDESQRCAGGLR